MDENVLIRVLVAERVKVLGYIQSIVRRPESAEDVFQDVCVLAVQKRQGIEGEAHLLNWLRTTARLTAINVLRKRQERHLSLEDGIIDLLEADWPPHDRDDSASLAEALRHCVDLLSPGAHELIRKRYVEGVGYLKLAEGLKRPVNSLYVTFSRIHAALADCIVRRIASEGGSQRG